MHYEKFPDGTVKCIEDEIPFELPEGWEWCKLRNICFMIAGKSKSKEEIKSEAFEDCYPCYGGNGQRGYVDTYNYDGKFSIIGRQGALCGNVNVAEGRFYATEHAVVVTLYDNIDFYWSTFILEALNINQYATGAAQPGLSVANVLNILVPLPPYKEQLRIADTLTKSIEIIKQLDADKSDLQTTIQLTKSKILDLAIRGKLVPQNPDDEPASVLLERIRAEKEELIKQGKIKRDKKEAVIFRGDDNSYYEKIGDTVTCIDEELPFDIPDNWAWTRLSSACTINPRNNIIDDTTVSFVPMTMIQDGYANKYTFEQQKWAEVKKGFTHFAENDVGFAKITPCFENRKSVVFRGLLNGYGAGTTELHILRVYPNTIIPEYLLYLVKLESFISGGKQTFSGAVGQQRVGKEYVCNYLCPIPPLSEQKRIIDKCSEIMIMLHSIEKSLS